jgi:hypothetical protein
MTTKTTLYGKTAISTSAMLKTWSDDGLSTTFEIHGHEVSIPNKHHSFVKNDNSDSAIQGTYGIISITEWLYNDLFTY